MLVISVLFFKAFIQRCESAFICLGNLLEGFFEFSQPLSLWTFGKYLLLLLKEREYRKIRTNGEGTQREETIKYVEQG